MANIQNSKFIDYQCCVRTTSDYNIIFQLDEELYIDVDTNYRVVFLSDFDGEYKIPLTANQSEIWFELAEEVFEHH